MDLAVLNWITFSKTYLMRNDINNFIPILERALSHRCYLVGDNLTEADCNVFMTLSNNEEFNSKLNQNLLPQSISRYYNYLKSLPQIELFIQQNLKLSQNNPTKEVKDEKSTSNSKFEDGGKFVGLKDAVNGQVVVRFPPEASGYLHIGHAKAALINQHYKNNYNGKLIMRFDDTNPAKESSEFEDVILEDVKTLGISYDILSYTSNHFDVLIKYCEQLILSGNAYADNTEPEIMKKERELCQDSKCRNQSVEDNSRLWKEMMIGSEIGMKCCIRLKLDMASKNGCMRDPTIYRCKAESHVRTGEKYKVYPTYDFACPIVDSLEGVTHSLRTSEYNDRNEQFYAILDLLSLRKPIIGDYSRLSLQNTVLSKRKLTWIVANDYVDGWDDPRMPTVRGILRHGMTVEGLKEFVIAQGFGRANVVMEWDKIWAFNKKVIDPIAPRYTGLSGASNDLIRVYVRDQTESVKGEAALHPKNPEIGVKDVWYTDIILVERSDVNDFVIGSNVTFVNWGNLRIEAIEKDINGDITTVKACLNLEDKDFKKTLKVTWLPLGPNANISTYSIPISVVTFSDLITKNVLDKDDDFKNYVNIDSRKEECMIGDRQMCCLKKGDIIQIQRKGYFICDEPYQEKAPATGHEYPLVLINIPEGNKKERVTTGLKQKSTTVTESDSKKAVAKKGDNVKEAEKTAERTNVSKQSGNKKELAKTLKNAKETEKTTESTNVLKEFKNKKEAEKTTVMSNVLKENEDKVPESKKNKKSKSIPKVQTDSISVEVELQKKQTRLCIEVTKEENFSEWYTEVLLKGKWMKYTNVSGCYVILPDSFFIWESIQGVINKKIKELGVRNAYYQMLIAEESLVKEKDHIADFSPEVAWVTSYGDKKMDKRLAIRPTSETAMYPSFSEDIKSHRDLPLKINQWCNVVRWEFKNPVPFLRSREFLWQEGHTAYASQADAVKEVYEILDLYAYVYEHLLAIPVVKGRKTEKEKFAGADFTTTTEIYIPGNGRAIQGATSHHLGQNFSKMFDIKYLSEKEESLYVYQNSWGMTTRTIGVVVMVHGDNQGLVLPPRVADIQVVIVPCGITARTSAQDTEALIAKCREVERCLKGSGITVKVDLDDRSPGWKFNYWELKGVPVRIEIGPRDLARSEVVLCYRYNGQKESVADQGLDVLLAKKMDDIHDAMYERARLEMEAHRMVAYSMEDLCRGLDQKMLITAPFCGDKDCEDQIKTTSARDSIVEEGAPSMGAKSLCIPLDQPANLGDKCINGQCRRAPVFFTMFGRSY